MMRPAIDYTSPEWHKVHEWLQEEYVDVLKEISRPSLEERRADFLRGKAAFISTLLDFANQPAA